MLSTTMNEPVHRPTGPTSQFEYVFGQNITDHKQSINPAPSLSGVRSVSHRLLSGPPTLNDIHQIFSS